ncbi:TetR/AcrR family transcriptional regulator [Saccharomonospora viridis]|jgi:AcrR family transcriptional regulator|uniref:Transcriptional regulator, TetR family n=2 Tax=Saccharomonospora viridis TaxID=1852 RepID=C7MTT6_SACVD|nr:TetR/AcrR family transcriptional regulator [Saccharomonospora viridis]ACU96819.1 transcriptional regulator, TetR family [Saccharomonospora viridis DSM 43017]KHF43000.1 TetR family transcriptional regulator [Saccharomonospora viridis]SFO86676.1 transcriptional regulator, TetR family [Saccharomonospora viridis]
MPTQTLSTGESPRSKRKVILDAAIDHFGEVGFEHTKWATIASQVGIGQTALYHYFESKSHCLLTIMRMELDQSLARVREATDGIKDPEKALAAAITSAYEGASPRDALQRRILQNHMDLLSTPRQSEREEAERQRSRELVREIEAEWAALIRRGIKAGVFAKQDAHLATRLVLGLVVSIWRWYRPGGPLSLDQITEMVKNASLKMLRP